MKYYEEIIFAKDTIVIYYPFSWGGQFQDKKFWVATLNGDAEDYHLKEALIEDAKKNKREWVVLKYHRKVKGCKISIAKKSEGCKIVSFKTYTINAKDAVLGKGEKEVVKK